MSGRKSCSKIMRLTDYEIESIKTVFLEIFKHGELYIFGSRIDDNKRGGDIDIYIKPGENDNLSSKKVDFLVELKNRIGEQKIDVIIDRGENRLLNKIAEQGVLLCKN